MLEWRGVSLWHCVVCLWAGVVSSGWCVTLSGQLAVVAVGPHGFDVCWAAGEGVGGYELSVYGVDEDFNAAWPTGGLGWTGDTTLFDVCHEPSLPGGDAATDGNFLASSEAASDCMIAAPSQESSEWRFALGSPDFAGSGHNYIGFVLMSDRSLAGDIATNIFHGYYLRIGSNGEADPFVLYRSTGVGKVLVGSFSEGPTFGDGALKAGVTLRMTRSDAGVWTLYWVEGFDGGRDADVVCGTLVDSAYDTSSFIGVFAHASSSGGGCRVFLDTIELGARTYVMGYEREPLANPFATVAGLDPMCDYACSVVVTGDLSGGMLPIVGVRTRAPVCTNLISESIGEHGFRACWDPVTEATGYVFEVLAVAEEFQAPSLLRAPQWYGNHEAFVTCSDPVLPGGDAEAVGSYLATRSGEGDVALMRDSDEVQEWLVSLGSPDYDPSDANYGGVILMASTCVTGDVSSASFEGYFLKLGDSGDQDRIELWRKSGVTAALVGEFSQCPVLGRGALREGVQLRVTRSDAGLFRLWVTSGFVQAGGGSCYAGELWDATYGDSSCFGVFTHFSSPSVSRRLFVDHVAFGTSSVAMRVVDGNTCEQRVDGLKPGHGYLWRVWPVFPAGVGLDAASYCIETAGGQVLHAPSLFMFH